MSMEQIARDIREGVFPRKSEATLREEASPREYLKIKYSAPAGSCKCGKCQLVPPEKLTAWADEIDRLTTATLSTGSRTVMKLDVTVSSVMKDGGELIVSIRGWAESDPNETRERYLGEVRIPATSRASKSYHIGRRLIIDVRPA